MSPRNLPRCLVAFLVILFSTACREEPGTEILWDTFGVPHIFAVSEEEMFEAHGWAQMKSHGDLILRLYGEARGRAAEYWGEGNLESDIRIRTLGIPERARAWYQLQDAEMYGYLQAFVRGMNRFAQENRDALDDERERVLPVEVSDVLGHLLRSIHYTFVSGEGAVPRSLREGLMAETLGDPLPGSNAWAIGPSRSASGNAMLLANPHLPWTHLYTWYESHLVGPSFDAYGATLVGMPLVTIGFTDHLAWTHTVNTYDGSDVYEMELDGDGYRFDGERLAFDVKEDTILVRRENGVVDAHPLTILRSVHGPVLGKGDGRAYALRVAGIEEADIFAQYMQMLRARNLEEFQEAMAMLQMPMFTTMYADRHGQIMHLFNGLVPERSRGDVGYWAGVIPGNTSETFWTGYHPYQDLPRVVDPESGWLQNANDPPWTTTFPRALSPEDYPPYMAPNFMHPRAQRSARMLMEDESLTFQELVDYKHSTRMELADILLDDFLPYVRVNGSTKARAAAEVLEAWDRAADSESRGAVLFLHWANLLLRETRGTPFAETWDPEAPMKTPRGVADQALGLALLEAAADTVRARHGALDIPFGDVHRVRLDQVDLPANGQGDPFGVFRATWYERAENFRYQAFGGDSFVLAVEFSDPITARVVLPYGNASQPGSPHRTDQLAFFSRKELRPVWRTRAEIQENLEARKVWD